MVITIDGPAGSGKSSVAWEVARRLGYDFLDTGAMYRAIGLEAIRRQVDFSDHRELEFIARHVRIEFDFSRHPPSVVLNGEVVSHQLRSKECTNAASYVAVVGAIRELLVHQQRAIGQQRGNIVTEGRDQGTIVFPGADFKFYVDASPEERARRRCAQHRARGENIELQEILNQIVSRDKRDRERLVGPLEKPKDAIAIDSTNLNFEQVVEKIIAHVQARPS